MCPGPRYLRFEGLAYGACGATVKVSGNSTASMSILTAMPKIFACLIASAPENLIAWIRSDDRGVMQLLDDIETRVDEGQA